MLTVIGIFFKLMMYFYIEFKLPIYCIILIIHIAIYIDIQYMFLKFDFNVYFYNILSVLPS